MSGWFAMKRGITSHHIFKGQPERLAIWAWLLDNAAWKDTPHDINGHTVIVPRGSVCASERRIAAEVGVGYQVVRTFLDRLKAEHMINATVTHGRRVITLCNWGKYQVSDRRGNAASNAGLTHEQRIKEQVNNSSKEEGASPPSIWDAGLAVLTARGVPDKQARSTLGKWKKLHGEETALWVTRQIERADAAEPVSYGESILNKRQPERKGFVNMGAFGEGEVVR